MNRRDFFQASSAIAIGSWVAAPGFISAMAAPPITDIDEVITKAYAGLQGLQNKDGSFAPKLAGPGITALVTAGLLRHGKTNDDPVVATALTALEKSIQPDGGIYSQRLANYCTSVSLLAFHEANKNGKYDRVITNATKFLKTLQNNDPATESDSNYGGVGYDGRSRPDLSNTHFFIDALLSSGVSKDDPSIQKALVYVSRCQNLASEFNKLPFTENVSEDDKGGFVYNPNDAETKGGKPSKNTTPQGGLRSYGSMTYAGLKSLLYAGVSKEDARVKAAISWIRRHYTLEANPGQRDAGLYYYYHLFAKALDALGEELFVDSQGVKHDWKQELFNEIKKRQKPNGVWSNTNNAFMESSPELASAFALLALSYCYPVKK